MKLLYSRNEFILVPVLKFMLAYLTICMVNGELGYVGKLDNLGLVLIVSMTSRSLAVASSAPILLMMVVLSEMLVSI